MLAPTPTPTSRSSVTASNSAKLEVWPTARLGEEYISGLLGALPGLHEHTCSYDTAGGFVRRMREDQGTWLGHVMEHVALELQNVAGSDVSFGRTRSTDTAGEYNMVFQYKDEAVGREASRLALSLLHYLLPENLQPEDAPAENWDFGAELETFIRYAQRRELGPSTASLAAAADSRGIPWIRLNRYSLLQLGHGKFQKRIQATTTGNTSNIAVDLASDKEETNEILRDLGLPVPHQELVTRARGERRPRGRAPRLPRRRQAARWRTTAAAYRSTWRPRRKSRWHSRRRKEHQRTVIVESHIQGYDHRMLVVNGELIAVAKRVPGHVVGDGRHTIEELVDIVNEDPRRGIGHEKVLTRLVFDHQADRLLEQKGYDRRQCRNGEVVYLRSTAQPHHRRHRDRRDGHHAPRQPGDGRARHRRNRSRYRRRRLPDHRHLRSYRDTGGAICEINAAPGFRMHVAPSGGDVTRRCGAGDRDAVPAGHAGARCRSRRSPAPTARPPQRACSRTSSSWQRPSVGLSRPPTASTSTAA